MRCKLCTLFFLIGVVCAAIALPQPAQSEVFTREYRVSTGSDDATEYTTGEDVGYVSTGSSDLDLEVGKMVGVRFQGIQVPPGAVINNAYIMFTAEDPDSGSWVLGITGEASDDAAAFASSNYDISNRTPTAATATWSSSTSWSDDSTYVSPDLTSIVNEIVGRPGWVKGNSLVFIFLGQDDERDAWSYNGSSSRAPLLHIEFTSLNTHTITAAAGYGGTISPAGQVTVLDGDNETFNITPDAGNSVVDVLVDGIPQGSITSYPFTNVTTDHYITALFNLPAECSDLSSVPLSTVKRAAPPNIMFVLDDSGSMDWEFLTQEWNGLFGGFRYVFDDPGDNVYSDSSYILSGIERMQWKSQWSGYNKLYYNPTVTYEPWPTLNDADLDTPSSHPMNATPTFALNGTYYDFSIIVDNLDPGYQETPTAWGGESVYEPEWDGSARWTDTVGSTATFTPDLPEDGTYEVYAWWNCWTGRDTNAKITVTHQGGSEVIKRNQSADVDNVPICYGPPTSPCCGQWTLIGTYSFAAGTTGSVSIARHDDALNPSTGSSTVADAVKFVPTTHSPIDIKNAHYYTFEDTNENSVYDAGETVYLVVIEGSGGTYNTRYYQATVSGSGASEEVTDLVEVAEASVPDSVKSARTPEEERQNFANWYSYYRRRELTATAAVAHAIVNMQGVNVGFYSINQSLIQPVLSVKARGSDYTGTLLDRLYNLLAPVPDT
jgi:hypothetical protein